MDGMTTVADSLTTFLGRKELEVQRMDGGSDKVLMQQLAVKHYPKLMQARGDEMALVAIYCGRWKEASAAVKEPDREWAEELTPESHELVLKEGEKLNLDFFLRWFLRQQQRVEQLRPGLMEQLMASALGPKLVPKAEAQPESFSGGS